MSTAIDGRLAAVVALLAGCGGSEGAPSSLSGSDAGEARAFDVADAWVADVALETSLADAAPDVLIACSTPEAGYCPEESVLWLPLTGDPAACAPSALAYNCPALCPPGTLDCALSQDDAGANVIVCHCYSTVAQ